MSTLKKEFTSIDLDTNFKLVYYHGTGSIEYSPLLIDNAGVQRSTVDVFKFDNVDTVSLDLGNAITGTWTLYLIALTDVGGGTVRRLHNLDLVTSIPAEYRFALGKSGVPSKNITAEDLIIDLNSGLNFCKRDGSNATNVDDFRNTLDVYSKDEVDDAIIAQGLIPAFVGFVNITQGGNVFSSFNITLPISLGTSDYVVIASCKLKNSTALVAPVFTTRSYADGGFVVNLRNDQSGSDSRDWEFSFIIYLKDNITAI